MTPARKKVSSRSFQRLVLVFVLITILLFCAILYFAFSRTVISVTPRLEPTAVGIDAIVAESTELPPADRQAEPQLTPLLPGVIIETDVEAVQSFTGLSEQREEPAYASGTVTISNEWSRTQPLQAGTRLLSEGGKLFRTTERVDVPVGGSVDVIVVADEAGKAGEIGPGTFEIVALWEGLKRLIVGRNTEAFTGGVKTVATVTQADLNTARTRVLAALKADATALLEKKLQEMPEHASLSIISVLPNVTLENPTAKPGDITDSFSYSLKGTATGVAADAHALNTLIQSEVQKTISADHRLVRVDDKKTDIRVVSVNTETRRASIRATTNAITVVRLSSTIFDRAALAGKDRQEIQSHFSQFDEVERTDIHFSPFWVFRAPTLADHIEIKLLDPVESDSMP